MVDGPSLLYGSVEGLTAAVFAYLGYILHARTVSPESKLAQNAWVLFWAGLALADGLTSGEILFAAFSLPSFDVLRTIGFLQILLLLVALWGLVVFLLYVFRGKYYVTSVTILYAALYVLLLYAEVALHPTGYSLVNGQVMPSGEATLSTPILFVLVVGLLGPEIVGALLYFLLFFRTPSRAIRYRIGLVSLSLLVAFTLGVALPTAIGGFAGQLAGSIVTLACTCTILMAYRPPGAIRHWLGVGDLEEGALDSGGS